MSNFDFLKDFDSTLWKLGNRIEKNVSVSPSGVKADATTFLEHILKELLRQAGLKYNSRKPFTEQVDAVFRSDLKMSNAYRERIKNAYNYRNKIHDEFDDIEKHEFQDAIQLHEKLFYIARKFYRDYNEDYDEYKGVPDFKPLQIDISSDEVRMRDFNDIVDVKFDYCIVCGKPNHLNYSIYCHECSTRLDNANNFISIRNAFGKNARFTKEDLMEYGMAEGYVNQFLHSMVREDMIRASGRFYTFNNMHLDEYLSLIDDCIAVGELITRFREDKITSQDIKKSREYRLGKKGDETFHQFYIIVNREIIKKFEKDITDTEDIWKSIEYTDITEKRLKRWYERELGKYRRGDVNDAFVVFNNLLIEEYLDMKRQGILESEIRRTLNITDEIYEFFTEFRAGFVREVKKIKIDLLTKAITEGKTRQEVIEYAGVTSKEYDDLVKVADFNRDEFSRMRNRELESRKRQFVRYLYSFDLRISCSKAKIGVEDFYLYYENGDESSEFFVKSTEYLMDKYLLQRSRGKTVRESIETVGIKEEYLNRWLSRSQYDDFKNRNVDVNVALILRGMKKRMNITEIAVMADVKESTIKSYVKLGERGSETYRPLYDYYESRILPEKLSKFLSAKRTRSMRKAQESAKISDGELDKCYELGKKGDERFSDFYEQYFDIKKRTYVYHINRGKSHKIAMRESKLTDEEYRQSKGDLERLSRLIMFNMVLDAVSNDKTSNIAARKAGCTVDDIYEWYFKGLNGEEGYVEFYRAFDKVYVKRNTVPIQEKIDKENASIENLIRSNKSKFTRRDIEIWLEHGLITQGVIHLEEEGSDDDEDDKSGEVKKISISGSFARPNRKSTLGRVPDEDIDIEKLKREILKKS